MGGPTTLEFLLEELPRRAAEQVDVAGGLVGDSEAIRTVRGILQRLAPLDVTVLLTGESGTGKGRAAAALRSPDREGGPFVSVNCAAIPSHLLESELFGHERGAFTGAHRAREGVLRGANGGVLFLDEIDALSPSLQAKLLRALDQRTVRPVGSAAELPFDARIVAAANVDLARAAEAGEFRRDLYYRLKVFHLYMPPLRDRRDDVLLLAQVFLERAARLTGRGVVGLTPEAADRLLAHRWPGNVRELENCILRAVVLSRYDLLTPATIELRRRGPSSTPGTAPLVPLEVMELAHVAGVMDAAHGDVGAAASMLGVTPRTLRRQLERFGLEGHGEPDD